MEACWSSLLNSDLSSVLLACEPELQELMRQVDIMMSQQRSEWEAQVRDLKLRLKGCQEEIFASKVVIQRKDLEIGVLRKQVEDVQVGRQDLATKYEKQLGKVSEELDKLKRSYQKLERRHVKKAITEECKSKEEYISEVRILQASERKHADCCADVKRMRAQLEKVHHELHTQEVELERLRALENTRLGHDRREQHDKTEEVERLHNDISTLKNMVHDKEQAIHSLKECLMSHDFARVEKLRDDLQTTSADLDRARATEANLKGQVMQLKQRLEEMSGQHVKAQQEARVLKDAFDTSVEEVKRLQRELSRAELQHSGEVDFMRKKAEASSAASLASLTESCVTGQDRPQLRPEIAQTPRPPTWAAGGHRPALHGQAAGDHSKTAAESSGVDQGTSYDGDIQRLFTQLHSSGSRQPPSDSTLSGGKSTLTKTAPEGRCSVSPSPPDVWAASSQVDAAVSHYLEKERLHSKELLHKLDTHILGMGDSNAASIAKCLNAKTS
ncbi:centrosomal protein of 63 kDa [Hippocampus zosterae]|uniref:centrosomal protein of 63 kDa n=1 Tax=Hippocampus zosterae TaxID=109293 RepID=UPI00223DE742|nr:centrosomal protein of 63 kDa [Hippocampus zosterae]XP_051929038.1 centrosomal protein of 63 kDa [Hippocampus zosterae]